MNFGEKFPYALLTFSQKFVEAGYWENTFSQKFVEAGYWVHLIPKTCQVDCSTHAHLSQTFVEAGYWVHYTPIITRTPSSTSTPYPTLPTRPTPHTPYTHTNHTPTIHNPTTPPIPLLLRVDSDEMWQKPVGFWLMRHWNARSGPVWGQKSTKWTPRLRGRKRRWVRCTARMGRLRILPSLRRQSSRKP